jgi:hypothetical protein
MAVDTQDRGRMRVTTPDEAPGGYMLRALGTLVVLIVVLLVTGVFLVGSDGGREFIEGRIGRWLGEDVRIERTRVAWPYVLVIEKLQTRGIENGGAGCKALEVRLSVGAGGRWCARVLRGMLNLDASDSREVRPAVLAGLGELPWKEVSEISRLTETIRQRGSIDIDDSAIHWLSSNGIPVAAATGVSFRMQPADVPGWRMTHYRLVVRSWIGPDGMQVRDTEREWLAAQGCDYVEIRKSEAAARSVGRNFWGDSE